MKSNCCEYKDNASPFCVVGGMHLLNVLKGPERKPHPFMHVKHPRETSQHLNP